MCLENDATDVEIAVPPIVTGDMQIAKTFSVRSAPTPKKAVHPVGVPVIGLGFDSCNFRPTAVKPPPVANCPLGQLAVPEPALALVKLGSDSTTVLVVVDPPTVTGVMHIAI